MIAWNPATRADPEIPGPADHDRRLVLCLALTAFVFQFEAFQVIVAVPAMAADFHLTTSASALIVTLYLLAATLVFIPAGKLADACGHKRTFLAAAGLLAAGCLACALAAHARGLWVGRVLQGAGGGALAALAYALVPLRVPRDRMGAAFGAISFAAALGTMAGAPVGGWLATALSWRWVFWANLPLVGGLLLMAWRWLPGDAPAATRSPLRLNALGALLLGGALGTALLGLNGDLFHGQRPFRAGDAALLFVACLGLLVLHERRSATPLVSRDCWRDGHVSASLVILFLVKMTLGGITFLLPFYLELLCGLSPFQSGLVLTGYTLLYAVLALGAGRVADQWGSRAPIVTALALGLAACLGLAGLAGAARWALAMLALAALGMSAGLFYSPNHRHIMAGAPAGHTGEMAAVLALAANTGTAVGVALFETVGAMGAPAPGAALHLRGFEYAFGLAAALFATMLAASLKIYPPRTRQLSA